MASDRTANTTALVSIGGIRPAHLDYRGDTVDASIQSGDMPIRLFDDTGDFMVSGYPILAVGDEVTVRGYTIAVVDDSGSTHTVRISRGG